MRRADSVRSCAWNGACDCAANGVPGPAAEETGWPSGSRPVHHRQARRHVLGLRHRAGRVVVAVEGPGELGARAGGVRGAAEVGGRRGAGQSRALLGAGRDPPQRPVPRSTTPSRRSGRTPRRSRWRPTRRSTRPTRSTSGPIRASSSAADRRTTSTPSTRSVIRDAGRDAVDVVRLVLERHQARRARPEDRPADRRRLTGPRPRPQGADRGGGAVSARRLLLPVRQLGLVLSRGEEHLQHPRRPQRRRSPARISTRTGKDLLKGGGTLLLETDGRFIGPGHAGRAQGRRPILAELSLLRSATRTAAPRLAIRALEWDADGWPRMAGKPITPAD